MRLCDGAGRLTRVAASGQKLRFYDLRGDGQRLQVMASLVDHDASTGDFVEIHNAFRRGDIVGKEVQRLIFPHVAYLRLR